MKKIKCVLSVQIDDKIGIKQAGVFSLIPAGKSVGVEQFFLYVICRLCTVFQIPSMPATGQKVCGGGVVVCCGCVVA